MSNRRTFVKQLMAGSLLLPSASQFMTAQNDVGEAQIHPTPAPKEIRIALIGKGGQGTGDTNVALQVPGVRLVAVCDLYDQRLKEAKALWGEQIFTTRSYQEILERKDVDAVIIGTPDHWHQAIAIAAMKAGKDVYCEKPVIHKISEAKALINAQQISGRYFQAGSQGMASLGNRKARQLVQAGILGKINFIDGQFTSGPRELGVYPVPDDASPQTIWWERFLGNAPKVDFDPQRFFYWRNWKDYGTGIAGDLFVHVIASLHYITGAIGPEKIYTTGGTRHYTDGCRDTPDIMLSYMDYPDRNNIGAFTVQLGANYVDGISNKWGSLDIRFIGTEGSLDVGWDKVTFKSVKKIDLARLNALPALGQGIDEPHVLSEKKVVFNVAPGYKGGHYDHFANFFTGIRNKTPLVCDVMFAVRSAAPALLSYKSFENEKAIFWDPEKLKELKRLKR